MGQADLAFVRCDGFNYPTIRAEQKSGFETLALIDRDRLDPLFLPFFDDLVVVANLA